MIFPRLCAALAAGGILAAQAVSLPAHAAVSLLEQRILAQQGLAVGLATITLRSQFVAFGGIFFDTGCNSIGGGGSFDVVSSTPKPAGVSGRIKIYFDAACKNLYLDETLSLSLVSSSPVTYSITATAQVFSKAAKKVGTLTLTNNRLSGPTPTTLKLVGAQRFKPVAAGAPELSMGISCEMPRTSSAASIPVPKLAGDIVCSTGVAQNFPLLSKAAASLSKITLRVAANGKVTFIQTTAAQLKTGALGALSVNVSAAGVVSIGGTSAPYGTTTLSGQASRLTLFPPKPVTWTVVDQGHAAKFTIQLLDNTTRQLGGSIQSTSTGVVAQITVDQSGTGTIKYSNGVTAPISSWVLSK